MAVIRQKSQGASAKNPVSDWDGFMHSLAWPAGLSEKDRISLFRRGKKDARRGLVGINEYGEITSPFCESLVQLANQRIAIEWMGCTQKALNAQAQIEQIELKVKELDRHLRDATVRRDEALDAINRYQFDGDAHVSEHLSTRRKINREKRVLDAFERESQAINARILEAEMEVIPYRYVLSQAEEAAMSREQIVRADYLWRLSVYAYGASNYIKIMPDMINDSALSDEPRKEHERTFGNTSTGSSDLAEQQ